MNKQLTAKVVEDIVETKLQPIRQEIAEIKTDLSNVKTDLAGVKYDLAEFRQEFSEFKVKTEDNQDKIMTMLSEIVSELQTSRQEQAALSHKVYQDHENRLDSLEQALAI